MTFLVFVFFEQVLTEQIIQNIEMTDAKLGIVMLS